MLIVDAASSRQFKTNHLDSDLVIVGGGLAGTCTAITAAREGIRVVLIQDRPVLGGNASSEVRLWILGATSHMGNNNRWAREGGVIDEILVENMYRNSDGNPLILDTILLEKVRNEPNITLLLNTCVFEAEKSGPETISSVRAFCSQNSTMYEVKAPLFCDSSGDGVLGFLAGAAFRIGAESREEFDEALAPETANSELLGHSIYFYSKDVGRPVDFIPPNYALDDITTIPRYRSFNTKEDGCRLWWIEYGGNLDTVHDTEDIKWELWKVVYGVWDHFKNSGEFPEARNLTLEWVGTIPGKRESRRFEGDYMLSQRDIVEQRIHRDAVSFGGWAVDLHPADGVYSEKPGCTQWHSKGVYQIPYRCMYSHNINNLFLTGRIISTTHVAFGSSRVMATCAHNGQAVAVAASMCVTQGLKPRDLLEPDRIAELQRRLLRTGQHIPGIKQEDPDDLSSLAAVEASSSLELKDFPMSDAWITLDRSRGMLIPMPKGRVPKVSLWVRAAKDTKLSVQLRGSSKPGNYTPDEVLATKAVAIRSVIRSKVQERVLTAAEGSSPVWTSAKNPTGRMDTPTLQKIDIDFDTILETPRYIAVCLMANEAVSVAQTGMLTTGLVSLQHKANKAVSKGGSDQKPPEDSGIDTFEFWLPERRPKGKLLAISLEPPLAGFSAGEVQQGPDRPVNQANAWISSPDDPSPWVELSWAEPQTISRVLVSFDTDHDHSMESVLMGHPEKVMPCCVREARLVDDQGNTVAQISHNHQTRWDINLDTPIQTKSLRLICEHPSETVPASVFRVRCFA